MYQLCTTRIMGFIKRIFNSKNTFFIKIFIISPINADNVFSIICFPMFTILWIIQEKFFHDFSQIDRFQSSYILDSIIKLEEYLKFIRFLQIGFPSFKIDSWGILIYFFGVVHQINIIFLYKEIKHHQNHRVTW